MVTINFTEARNSLKDVLDRVENDQDCTVITRRDSGDAVVMSADYYNQLMETVHLMSNSANITHLTESIAQYGADNTVERTLAAE